MDINLGMHHLRAIAALHRTGSFTAAALEVGVSQPALSRAIAEAERRTGTELFTRTTRAVLPTPAGDEVAAHATRAVQAFDFALGQMQGFLSGDAGLVRVACLPSVAATVLPSVVAGFRRDFPQVELSIHDAQQNLVLPLVAEGSADLGLVALDDDLPEGIAWAHLARDPFVAVVPSNHPLAGRPALTWQDFNGQGFIAFDAITSIGPLVTAALAREGVKVDRIQRAQSIAAVGGLVAAGMGISAVPELVLPLMNFDGVTSLALTPPLERRLVVIHRADAPLPVATERFRQRLLAGTAGAARVSDR